MGYKDRFTSELVVSSGGRRSMEKMPLKRRSLQGSTATAGQNCAAAALDQSGRTGS